MNNLQKKYEKFYASACYAFCLVKKFRPNSTDNGIARYALDGLDAGYIEDDGYVKSPVGFINNVIEPEGITVRDVVKVDFKKEELTEDANIVMYSYNGGTHFVIMNKEGDVTFDSLGVSNSVKYGVPTSIRKFITK